MHSADRNWESWFADWGKGFGIHDISGRDFYGLAGFKLAP